MNILENQLTTILYRNWWVLLLRGFVAITFGALIWLQPGISLATLVLFFGSYAMADGIIGVWIALSGRKEHEHWVVLLLGGLVGIGAGILSFLALDMTEFALLFYIAVWAIATGVLGIVVAIRLRKEIKGEWLLIFGSLTSVVFGVLLMVKPEVGALSLLWLIAIYAIAFGIILVLLAFKMRGFASQATRS